MDYVSADDGQVIDSFGIDNNPNLNLNPNTTTATADTVQLSFQQGVNGYSGTEDTFIQQTIAAIDNSRANSLNVDTESSLGAEDNIFA